MIIDVVYGFLGAGKTTFIRHLIDHPLEGEKLVILVNEFGEVGLDGLILSGHGDEVADIVEIPSGCICCTMAPDFRWQIIELHERFSPDRMVIEPTGIATISQIMNILEREDLEHLYSSIRLIHILDGFEFLSFIKSHRYFMENQIRAGNTVLLNKTDRLKPSRVKLLVNSVKEINPQARVFPTSFARIEPTILRDILGCRHENAKLSVEAKTALIRDMKPEQHKVAGEHRHNNEHQESEHEDPGGQYESFGWRYISETFDPGCLKLFFDELRDQQYGGVVRAKGIFRTQDEWIKLELASGEIHIDTSQKGRESMVSIIGRFMNISKMETQLKDCNAE